MDEIYTMGVENEGRLKSLKDSFDHLTTHPPLLSLLLLLLLILAESLQRLAHSCTVLLQEA